MRCTNQTYGYEYLLLTKPSRTISFLLIVFSFYAIWRASSVVNLPATGPIFINFGKLYLRQRKTEIAKLKILFSENV